MDEPKPEVFRTFSIAEAHKEAVEVIEHAQFKTWDFENQSDGSGLYDTTKIKKDEAFVERAKASIKAKLDRMDKITRLETVQRDQLAEIAEAVFDERMERGSGWLGGKVLVYKTSDLDDMRHGVDSVIGFDKDGDMLAVDITTATEEGLESKLGDIRRSLAGVDTSKPNRGATRTIEYFKSAINNEQRPLENIPVIVLGADTKHTRQIMQVWMQINEGMTNTTELDRSRTKGHVLGMMKMQLEHFRKYAKQNDRQDLIQTYDGHLKRLDKIIYDSGWPIDYDKLAAEDKVFKNMKKYLETNFR